MKSILVIGLIGLFLLSLSVSFVGAESWIKETADYVRPGINDLAGVFSELGESTNFVRVLFFILVFLIVFTVLSLVPLFKEKGTTKTLVAIIISILAVFFIPTELIKPMLNPYSAMGVALLTIIPFVLLFLFTRNMLTNTFLRKIVWMIFTVILLGLVVVTSTNIYVKEGVSSISTGYTWFYGLVSILALIMVFWGEWIEKTIWKGEIGGKIEEWEKNLQKRLAVDTSKEREYEETIGGAGV